MRTVMRTDMRIVMRSVLVLLTALVLAACTGGDAATRVVVTIEADPEVRARAAALRLRVESARVDAGVQEDEAFEQTLEARAFEWPARTTLVPRAGDASRTYVVEASALDARARPIAIVRARSGFVDGETRELVLRLETACLDVTSCAPDRTCVEGTCRDAEVDPRTLPRIESGETDDAGMDGSLPDVGVDACTPVETYADEDRDGYGDLSTLETSCVVPEGRVTRAGDCDDTCAACRPGGVETCEGERDEDCDGTADEGCACRTGATRACPGASDVGACVTGSQTCVEGTWSVCEGRVDPLPEECDGADDDCDARIDEGVVRACDSACGRGTQACSAGRWQTCSAPAPRAETCDGTDEDCDGRVDEGVLRTFYRDADGDGYGAESAIALACVAPAGHVARAGDCDDACRTCLPGGTETCDGRLDEDCDGTADEGCGCTDGATRACPGGVDAGECSAGTQSCVRGAWGACVGQVGPTAEVCNARDDDCDARVDEALARACGPATDLGVCERGTQVCSAGAWDVCRGAVYPGTESCNGLDDDCDGPVDEGACTPDAGPPDAGPPDAGPPDAGPPDPLDSGAPEPVPLDAGEPADTEVDAGPFVGAGGTDEGADADGADRERTALAARSQLWAPQAGQRGMPSG